MATPTLMGIPAELRLRIFDIFINGVADDHEVIVDCDYGTLTSTNNDCAPLFGVSRQVNAEADDRFRLTLHIYQIDNAAGPAWQIKDILNLKAPYTSKYVNTIVLQSLEGLDGDHINTTHFPNLKTVVVEQYIRNATSQVTASQPKLMDYVRCPTDLPFEGGLERVDTGEYDHIFIATAKEAFSKWTFKNVPAYEQRGYKIICQVIAWLQTLPNDDHFDNKRHSRDLVSLAVYRTITKGRTNSL